MPLDHTTEDGAGIQVSQSSLAPDSDSKEEMKLEEPMDAAFLQPTQVFDDNIPEKLSPSDQVTSQNEENQS